MEQLKLKTLIEKFMFLLTFVLAFSEVWKIFGEMLRYSITCLIFQIWESVLNQVVNPMPPDLELCFLITQMTKFITPATTVTHQEEP